MVLRSKAAGRDKGTMTSTGRMQPGLYSKVAALLNFGSKTCQLAEVCKTIPEMTNPPCVQVSERWPAAAWADEQKGHRCVGGTKVSPAKT